MKLFNLILQSAEFFEQHKEKEEELKRLVEKIGIAQNIVSLKETNAMLKNDNEQLTFENEALEKAKTTLAEDIANYSESLGKTIANSRFDSMITSKVFDVMSDYDKQQEEQSYYSIQKLLASIESVSLEPNELTNYLCGAVRRARPRYDENTIINIAICITQGFLTFFSGEPGCGKTSICNIMGSAFGAKGFDCYGTSAISASRFVAISVQRGWTTQKDLIGYYNPLTKTYDKSNQKLYDALKILDIEKRQDEEKFPCLVLLDEANLSPMEYYWADFMNVCDGIDEGSEIDLGNGNVLGVPNNLRFLATANSDFTTENLSPRLIDRAWVITLPKTQFAGEDDLRLDEIQKLSWASLWDAYGKPQEHVCFQEDQSEVFNELKKLFKEQYFDVSYRTQRSMEDYCYVAQKYMTNDQYDRDSTVVAMDYAVAQKLLPKIKGSGHEFKKWLQDVAELCKTYSLIISADLINAIIQKGDKRMSYYSFF